MNKFLLVYRECMDQIIPEIIRTKDITKIYLDGASDDRIIIETKLYSGKPYTIYEVCKKKCRDLRFREICRALDVIDKFSFFNSNIISAYELKERYNAEMEEEGKERASQIAEALLTGIEK